jgi:DMSO/TMAO reductase YedYZ molybdopterin-dependent catalytic subunit
MQAKGYIDNIFRKELDLKTYPLVLSDDESFQIQKAQRRYSLPSVGSVIRFLIQKDENLYPLESQINELREMLTILIEHQKTIDEDNHNPDHVRVEGLKSEQDKLTYESDVGIIEPET